MISGERADVAQRPRQTIPFHDDERVRPTAPEPLECCLQTGPLLRATAHSNVRFYVDELDRLQLAIGSQLIALCVQTYPVGNLLLCAHPHVSERRLVPGCMLVCAHAAVTNSRCRT